MLNPGTEYGDALEIASLLPFCCSTCNQILADVLQAFEKQRDLPNSSYFRFTAAHDVKHQAINHSQNHFISVTSWLCSPPLFSAYELSSGPKPFTTPAEGAGVALGIHTLRRVLAGFLQDIHEYGFRFYLEKMFYFLPHFLRLHFCGLSHFVKIKYLMSSTRFWGTGTQYSTFTSSSLLKKEAIKAITYTVFIPKGQNGNLFRAVISKRFTLKMKKTREADGPWGPGSLQHTCWGRNSEILSFKWPNMWKNCW